MPGRRRKRVDPDLARLGEALGEGVVEPVEEAAHEATSLAPTPKVAAAGALGTPLGLVVVWALGEAGVDMPPEVGAALGALIAAAVGYLKSSRGYLEP